MQKNMLKGWWLLGGLSLALLTGCGGGKPTGAPSAAYIPAVGASEGTMAGGYVLTKVLLPPSKKEVRLMHLVNEVRTRGTVNGVSAVADPKTCFYRADGKFTPRPALSYSGVLAHAASMHARYMGNVGYQAHQEAQQLNQGYEDETGDYFWGEYKTQRIERTLKEFGFDAKYDFLASSSGENVAAGTPGVGEHGSYIDGYSNAEQTLWAWLRSPDHCLNMMNSGWHYMGMGYFYNAEPEITPSLRRHMHSWVQVFATSAPPKPTVVWE